MRQMREGRPVRPEERDSQDGEVPKLADGRLTGCADDTLAHLSVPLNVSSGRTPSPSVAHRKTNLSIVRKTACGQNYQRKTSSGHHITAHSTGLRQWASAGNTFPVAFQQESQPTSRP